MPRLEQNTAHILNLIDLLIGKIPTTQTNRVDSDIRKWIVSSGQEWRNIFTNQRAPTNHNVRADTRELMHSTMAAQNSPIIKLYLTGQ